MVLERLTSLARLFADDTAVYRAVLSYLDQTQLQQDLRRLTEREKNQGHGLSFTQENAPGCQSPKAGWYWILIRSCANKDSPL